MYAHGFGAGVSEFFFITAIVAAHISMFMLHELIDLLTCEGSWVSYLCSLYCMFTLYSRILLLVVAVWAKSCWLEEVCSIGWGRPQFEQDHCWSVGTMNGKFYWMYMVSSDLTFWVTILSTTAWMGCKLWWFLWSRLKVHACHDCWRLNR